MELSEAELGEVRAVLVRAVRARCPRQLADRADDIVQNAMIKVIRLHREGKGSLLLSYLWRVAFPSAPLSPKVAVPWPPSSSSPRNP